MSWTNLAENSARCGGALGAVRPQEEVARHLHSKIDEPRQKAFKREELFGLSGQISNECGQSTGISVDRCSNLSDQQIDQRCITFAAQRPGRQSKGSMIAQVAALRSVVIPNVSGQVVFVYDDPDLTNAEHAIVRARQGLSKAQMGFVRDEVIEAFGHRHVP